MLLFIYFLVVICILIVKISNDESNVKGKSKYNCYFSNLNDINFVNNKYTTIKQANANEIICEFHNVCIDKDLTGIFVYLDDNNNLDSLPPNINIGTYEGSIINIIKANSKDFPSSSSTTSTISNSTIISSRSNTDNYFHTLLDDILGISFVSHYFKLYDDFNIILFEKEQYKIKSTKLYHLFEYFSGNSIHTIQSLFSSQEQQEQQQQSSSSTSSSYSHVCFNNLYVGASNKHLGGQGLYNTSKEIVLQFKNRLISKVASSSTSASTLLPKKIENCKDKHITIISRKGDKVPRRIENEDELLNYLLTHYNNNNNVKSVEFDKLSFMQQIRIIENTNVLIGMHGAGLANLVFLDSKCGGVIEIWPYKVIRPLYHIISDKLGIPWKNWKNTIKENTQFDDSIFSRNQVPIDQVNYIKSDPISITTRKLYIYYVLYYK